MALSRFHALLRISPRLVLSGFLLAGASMAISGCASTPPGCQGAHNYREKPPKYSSVIREGRGKLEFLANNPGRAVVFDACEHHLVQSLLLHSGDQMAVHPEADKIMVNGKVVATPEFNIAHLYRVYWLDDYDRDLAHDKQHYFN